MYKRQGQEDGGLERIQAPIDPDANVVIAPILAVVTDLALSLIHISEPTRPY